MKRCPITYEIIPDDAQYSLRGLKLLSRQLTYLEPLDYSAGEQRSEALARAGKMSIQGVQAKLSARLSIKAGHFEIVDQLGNYILKPQSDLYPELPENEALTMTLAARVGIEVPIHGMVYSKDNSMTYFIKRFDHINSKNKLAVEDFAQLSLQNRDTKYNSSMEKVAGILNYCSFPKIESVELFKRVIFNFLIGNEDMHLKNFSLITRDNNITLSPAYDFLNTTIAQANTQEELALPLNGKKTNLSRKDFIDYFAIQRLGLSEKIVSGILQVFAGVLLEWEQLIQDSFLSEPMREKYLSLLGERSVRLGLK